MIKFTSHPKKNLLNDILPAVPSSSSSRISSSSGLMFWHAAATKAVLQDHTSSNVVLIWDTSPNATRTTKETSAWIKVMSSQWSAIQDVLLPFLKTCPPHLKRGHQIVNPTWQITPDLPSSVSFDPLKNMETRKIPMTSAMKPRDLLVKT